MLGAVALAAHTITLNWPRSHHAPARRRAGESDVGNLIGAREPDAGAARCRWVSIAMGAP